MRFIRSEDRKWDDKEGYSKVREVETLSSIADF